MNLDEMRALLMDFLAWQNENDCYAIDALEPYLEYRQSWKARTAAEELWSENERLRNSLPDCPTCRSVGHSNECTNPWHSRPR